jgi:hypothetical protein
VRREQWNTTLDGIKTMSVDGLKSTESGGEDYYGEGSLSFDGNKLYDYDGVFDLDSEVIKCLKEWGADTSEIE